MLSTQEVPVAVVGEGDGVPGDGGVEPAAGLEAGAEDADAAGAADDDEAGGAAPPLGVPLQAVAAVRQSAAAASTAGDRDRLGWPMPRRYAAPAGRSVTVSDRPGT